MTESKERMRVAYFVSSYRCGEQMLRLVRRLQHLDPDGTIVIHHDEFGRDPLDRRPFDELGVTVLTSPFSINWGDLTLDRARWRVFGWILEHLDVDWVVLLSEQCYPISPMADLHRRLAATPGDAIFFGWPIDECPLPQVREDFRLRYYYQYRALPRLPGVAALPAPLRRLVRTGVVGVSELVNRVVPGVRVYNGDRATGSPTRLGVRSRGRLFSAAFPCWANGTWGALTPTAMRAVLDHLDEHPEYERYYARTVIPVESATLTILFNHPDLTVENASLHAIRWSRPLTGRPDVYTKDDLEHLVAAPEPFARKFSDADSALLDALDARIDGAVTSGRGGGRGSSGSAAS